MSAAEVTTLDQTALTPFMGVEVGGVDLSQPVAPAPMAAIRAALAEHALLLFRGQTHLTAAAQIAFSHLLWSETLFIFELLLLLLLLFGMGPRRLPSAPRAAMASVACCQRVLAQPSTQASQLLGQLVDGSQAVHSAGEHTCPQLQSMWSAPLQLPVTQAKLSQSASVVHGAPSSVT